MKKLLTINQTDDVAISLTNLNKGEKVNTDTGYVSITDNLPSGHKVCIRPVRKGCCIKKYGYPIGTALEDIFPGNWVHSHNLTSNLEVIPKYEYKSSIRRITETEKRLSFEGYRRKDGKAAIRNEIWIIPTVNCINQTAKLIEYHANNDLLPVKGIDGIYAFCHPYGCSQLGEDFESTRQVLAALANHPNAAGVLILGLGCENNSIAYFREKLDICDVEKFKFLNVQEAEDELEEGKRLISELIKYASGFEKQNISISELRIGLKCGGSDGLSGITANPLVGKLTDLLIENGSSAVLTEVPEMFGAEQILMDRSCNLEVFQKTVDLINNFKHYFLSHNQPVHENPSPGNIEGGITTLEEKSLGAILKGGSYEVSDVIPYGSTIKKSGLTLLEGPGNDLISITAQAASGCHLILFTTGRGTPLGACIPTLKISTNSHLFEKKTRWIDFDAGRILSDASMDELAQELLNLVISTASGTYRAKNEINGYREIGIWKKGITL